jgi:diadenosine tetraphosphate (Ap4A) HIT family hydrolase
MADCTFCRIATGELPASLIHADEHAERLRAQLVRAPG